MANLWLVCGILISFSMIGMLESSNADQVKKELNKEKTDHAKHQPIKDQHFEGEEHNFEYDHEAVLGSHDLNEKYGHQDREISQEMLGDLVEQIDTNKDGFVTKEELSAWVNHSFLTLDEEEALKSLHEVDRNGDEQVTFEEFVDETYGVPLHEIKDAKHDKNSEMRHYAEMVEEEESKFKIADKNGDKILDKAEYAAFIHPWDYEHMHDFEIARILGDLDKNNDFKLDLKEYLKEGEQTMDKETLIVEKEQFNDYDKNKDGVLDRGEIKAWVLPDQKKLADEEAIHLIGETDSDHDGKLTKEEIVEQVDLWVGSQATDFGARLHDPEEL